MNEVTSRTIEIEQEDYRPMPGEVFFHKVETSKRKYMISLRRVGNGFLISLADQLKPTEQEIKDNIGSDRRMHTKIHRIRIYDEAIEDFIIGFNRLGDKLNSLKK